MDNELRFRTHVRYLLKNCYSSLKYLYQFNNILSKRIKKIVCESIVLSRLSYCDILYGPCIDGADRRRLQLVQNSCLRYIHGVRKYQRITYLLEPTGWLSMINRRKLHAACLFYKIVRCQCPSYLYNKLTFRSDVHSVYVRSRELLSIPKHRTEMFKRSFSYNIVQVYNEFSEYSNMSLSSFKKHCKKKLTLRQFCTNT